MYDILVETKGTKGLFEKSEVLASLKKKRKKN